MKRMVAWGLGILLVAGVAAAQEGKGDLDRLQGTWVAEVKGKTAEMKFARNSFTLTFDGKESYKGTFKIDPAKSPKQMDLMVKEGKRHAGKTAVAIYAFEGDTLKWSSSEPGDSTRADRFPAKVGEGSKQLFLVFKRVK